jgi:hypothetical protein
MLSLLPSRSCTTCLSYANANAQPNRDPNSTIATYAESSRTASNNLFVPLHRHILLQKDGAW